MYTYINTFLHSYMDTIEPMPCLYQMCSWLVWCSQC